MGMTERDYMTSYEMACRQAELLSAYQAALTLPDGTVMGPEEVAAALEITRGPYGFCPDCGDAYELDIVDGKPVMMCDGCGPLIALAEVAALVARCEAAEADLAIAAQDSNPCSVCAHHNNGCEERLDETKGTGEDCFVWSGPQEGAVAHERV